MNQDHKAAYESTLKFIKEEEFFDRYFYRPIGFRLALFFNWLKFTPNAVTIVSVFVGLSGAICFYFDDFQTNLIGVLLFISANLLDCADGQLARLTKSSSRVGRIFDGFAGDTWFITMYFMLSLRAMFFYDLDAWVFIPIALSGIFHGRQAEMADFFKNVHLHFVKGGKGGEVDNLHDVLEEYGSYTWLKSPFKKVLLYFYIGYTKEQTEISPEFNQYKEIVASKFGNLVPQDLVSEWCTKNRSLLYYVHALSFNGRTLFLFPLMLLGCWWWYIAVELILLNVCMFTMICKYRVALKELNAKLLCRVGESN